VTRLPPALAGYEVTVVQPDPAHRSRAVERAGAALERVPLGPFDAVVAPTGTDLAGIDAAVAILVEPDGSVLG